MTHKEKAIERWNKCQDLNCKKINNPNESWHSMAGCLTCQQENIKIEEK